MATMTAYQTPEAADEEPMPMTTAAAPTAARSIHQPRLGSRDLMAR